jgi:phospholipase C
MKLMLKVALILSFGGVAYLYPQTIAPGTFKHIVIIVQENRTPDNIFGAGPASHLGCGTEDPFTPGVDVENGGETNVSGSDVLLCNVSQPMNNGPSFDPGHFYSDWYADYHGGHMDGFCHTQGETLQQCEQAPNPYSYIQQSDVQPYFDIAKAYGFANYMFQTNEGPSYEAHQFLFTGTSAPVAPGDQQGYHWDFVLNNAGFDDSGCPYKGENGFSQWIQPDRSTIADPLQSECYTHDSLVTNSNCTNGNCDKDVSWRYYSPSPGAIWDAPAAIPEVCYGENDTTYTPDSCGTVNGGYEWLHHMTFYSVQTGAAQIFNDISNCQLQQVTWVIPDKAWSDHPSFDNTVSPPYGPSWVGDIIDSIGKSYSSSNGNCDYWGTAPTNSEPTAIFVVWDDWGGFFDHVATPPQDIWTGMSQGGDSWSCAAPNQWGCGYTYGLRVPLLVVSEYTGTLSNGQYSGYVSGACGGRGMPMCPNLSNPYVHDFGSILRFTEYNFGLPFIDQTPDHGYADQNPLDGQNGNIPLSDFFSLWTGQGSAGRTFVAITTPYSWSQFETYYATHSATPTGPDTE